ncbi:MAG: serine/threonine-protein kinase [Myxococcota bacterium]
MAAMMCPGCAAELDVTAPFADACPRCGVSWVVAGGYRVETLVGRGGMGTVYQARHVVSGERVAVKVLTLNAGQDWKGYELFERSARVLQGLQHRALPHVHAFDHGADGRLVLVREIFDGGTLFERIKKERRHLSPHQAQALLESLLGILVYLHGRVPPVVHRDIKPQNIMFRSVDDWEPVLVDFDTVAAAPAAQRGNTIVATPGYAAPEQLAGDASPAVDLYAVGATMLFVLTHVEPDDLPRTRGRFDVEHLLGNVDPRVRQLILRLVEPDPGQRPASAEEALASIVPSLEQRTVPPEKRARHVVLAAGIVLTVVGVLGPRAFRRSEPVVQPVHMAPPPPIPTTPPPPAPPPAPEPPTSHSPPSRPHEKDPPRPPPKPSRPAEPSIEDVLKGLSRHIQSVTMAYGGYRTPRITLKASTNDTQALQAAVAVGQEMLRRDGGPEKLIGTRSGYALVYVDLPPEAVGDRQTMKPFALRELSVDGTAEKTKRASSHFGPPYLLRASRVHEQRGVAYCCKNERVGEVREGRIHLD